MYTTGSRRTTAKFRHSVEVRLVDRPVPEEGDRHRPVPGELGGERRARRGGDRAADDAETTHQSALEVGHVHRSASAAVRPGLAAQERRHQRSGVDSERERGTVSAVRGGDGIAGLEGGADSDRDRLLPLTEVRRSLNLVGEEEAQNGILEEPDPQHRDVEPR